MEFDFDETYGHAIITVVIACIFTAIIFLCVGCNKQIIDTTYTFDKAIMYVGGEWVTVNVDSWGDYEDGDQIQIRDTDGNVYLVHSSNVTLVKEK